MTRRLLDIDPYSGAIETHEYDEGTDTTIIRTWCDVQPIIDRNKELSNHTDGRHPVFGWHVANIPTKIVYKWLVEHGVNVFNKHHEREVFKLLNSNEYRDLRIKHIIL